MDRTDQRDDANAKRIPFMWRSRRVAHAHGTTTILRDATGDLQEASIFLKHHPTVAKSVKIGAGEGARTLDPDLGKVVLYH